MLSESDCISIASIFVDAAAVIISIIALVVACSSNKKANELSKESNLKLDVQNQIATHQFKSSLTDKISYFEVRLLKIKFTNDASNCASIDEALAVGSIECTFYIENLTDKDASSVQVISSMDFYDDTKGDKIIGKNHKQLKYLFQTYKFRKMDCLYDVSINTPTTPCNKKGYRDKAVIGWQNGVDKCFCEFFFDFYIEEYDDVHGRKCRLYASGNDNCKTTNYMINDTEI